MFSRRKTTFRIFHLGGRRRDDFVCAATSLGWLGARRRDDQSFIKINFFIATSNTGLTSAASLPVNSSRAPGPRVQTGNNCRRDGAVAGGLLEGLGRALAGEQFAPGHTLLVRGTASLLVHGQQRTAETSQGFEFVCPTLTDGPGVLVASHTLASGKTCNGAGFVCFLGAAILFAFTEGQFVKTCIFVLSVFIHVCVPNEYAYHHNSCLQCLRSKEAQSLGGCICLVLC